VRPRGEARAAAGRALASAGRALTLAVAVGLSGCRDAPTPFEGEDREAPITGAARLTFATGDENAPAWTPDGTRVVYASEGFDPFPLSDGVLLSIPAGGGAAQLALPGVQQGTLNPGVLAAPAVSADGEVAYLQITGVLTRASCSDEFGLSCDGPFMNAVPLLLGLRLIVRTPGSDADPGADPALVVRPEGFALDTIQPRPAGVAATRVLRRYPYQRSFRDEGIHSLHPSWHPSQRRLVFSDGLRLLTWTPGADPAPIPGTEHGFDADWSPTGEWIAYTRQVPEDSLVIECTQSGPFGTFCAIEEHVYLTFGPMVALVRPDGSEGRVLVPGSQPTFSADGTRVYYVADDGIRSVDLAGQGEAPVPGTAGGREPAVSPDGSRLAFSRATSGSFDLWVTPLP
jgi:hypothetical protein